MFTKDDAIMFIKVLNKGVDIKTACAFMGWSEEDLYYWLSEGKYESERRSKSLKPNLKKQLFVDLWSETRKARASSYAETVANIKMASAEDWRAAAWLIDKHFPKRRK